MKHKELRDYIQGAILKQEYLEAFLMQGVYIEGLLKVYIGYEYVIAISPVMDLPEGRNKKTNF